LKGKIPAVTMVWVG